MVVLKEQIVECQEKDSKDYQRESYEKVQSMQDVEDIEKEIFTNDNYSKNSSKSVPLLNLNFLNRKKQEIFEPKVHIIDKNDSIKKKSITLEEQFIIRTSNFDNKFDDNYDLPGLTTFNLSDTDLIYEQKCHEKYVSGVKKIGFMYKDDSRFLSIEIDTQCEEDDDCKACQKICQIF